MPARKINADEDQKPDLKVSDMEKFQEEIMASYKIEVTYEKHRSTLLHKPSPMMIQIWESGRRLHGGGDQKMYWCGYHDCQKPLTSDDFAYMHVVCRHCQREMFLDEGSRKDHVKSLVSEGRDPRVFQQMPTVTGELMLHITPPALAGLLEKMWHQLRGDADVYLKYSPHEIRYDKLHETTKDLENLTEVRVQRIPLIYSLKNIMKDLSAGADLKGRFLAMVTD